MEEWEIFLCYEKDKLHPIILKDIDEGVCPREVGNKLAAFSYELRPAGFGEKYTVSKVYMVYKKTKGAVNIERRLKIIEDCRRIYRKKAEEWERFLVKHNITKGYVYLLSNEYMPGLIKIGYTERNDVSVRKDELYYQGKPGVPDRFKIEYEKYTVYPSRSEKIIHEQLCDYRINKDREFFKIKLGHAKSIIDQVVLMTENALIGAFNEN